MRTEAALLEMNKAVDILREEITAEAKVDITNLNKADTTDSDKAYLSAIDIDNIPVTKKSYCYTTLHLTRSNALLVSRTLWSNTK